MVPKTHSNQALFKSGRRQDHQHVSAVTQITIYYIVVVVSFYKLVCMQCSVLQVTEFIITVWDLLTHM